MRLKNTTTLKRTQSKPSRSPTHELSAETDAACELGMPPVSTSRRKLIFFSRKRNVNTLLSCTRNPHASAWKSGFEAGVSAIPRLRLARSPEQKLGEGFEFLGPFSQALGDPSRLAQKPLRLALGALDPHGSGSGGLAARLVRAGGLADLLPRRPHVQEVVADLEREPHAFPVVAESALERGRRSADLRPEEERSADQHAGLSRVHGEDAPERHALSFQEQVHRLAPDHALRPGRFRDDPDQSTGILRLPLRGPGERLEREGQERVPREDGHALPVHDVVRGASAPPVVVVHAGEIVVDQGKGVDHLERGGGWNRGSASSQHRLAGEKTEGGPQSLAAREDAVSDRGVKRPGFLARARQSRRERRVDSPPGAVEVALKKGARPPHAPPRPRTPGPPGRERLPPASAAGFASPPRPGPPCTASRAGFPLRRRGSIPRARDLPARASRRAPRGAPSSARRKSRPGPRRNRALCAS